MKIRNICFIILLIVFMFDCHKSVTGPIPPVEIAVDIRYQRVDDVAACPRLWFDPRSVYLNGIGGPKEMPEIETDLFGLIVSNVKAYPKDYSGDDTYRIYVLDSAFFTLGGEKCATRAHKIWLNGYLIDKIYKSSDGEYLWVWFDYSGIPHSK